MIQAKNQKTGNRQGVVRKKMERYEDFIYRERQLREMVHQTLQSRMVK